MNSTSKLLILQSAKYVTVGFGLYILDYAIFLIIVLLNPDIYLVANVVARIIGAFAGFFLHKNWTFSGKTLHNSRVQFLLYISLLTLNILASSFMLSALVELIEFREFTARIIVDMIILFSTFVLSRLVVFRGQGESKFP